MKSWIASCFLLVTHHLAIKIIFFLHVLGKMSLFYVAAIFFLHHTKIVIDEERLFLLYVYFDWPILGIWVCKPKLVSENTTTHFIYSFNIFWTLIHYFKYINQSYRVIYINFLNDTINQLFHHIFLKYQQTTQDFIIIQNCYNRNTSRVLTVCCHELIF